MPHEKLKSLNDLDDVLIVQKIERKDSSFVKSSHESIQATQCLCFESGCDCERNALVEEQEAIIKKQLQMLQADERGKLALLTEIAASREREENRTELIRHRQHALHVEKERSRKIASLPPPLPKSVKVLLKQNDNEPKLSKLDVQMPEELRAIHIEPIDICCKNIENKENIIDPKELEFKQKMSEEWNMKAKKRFNEALKKDRQKEEYSKTMMQIKNAELLSRQEMAKNISADKKGMPCPLSDKIQTARKQVDMEDAAERIFKKTGTKEHVIEDIEGYQDHYEEKYKNIDSTTEAKMIDCVPSFLKENYDYLLEDDSKFIGGKNFSGFDDSTNDVFNQAYIETPPGDNELHESKDIHHEISHLDRLRSNLETEIEHNYKPLLAAAIEVPKRESKDQAVETESFKVPAEDKAVETDVHFRTVQNSPSPTATFNFANAGVMAYKRRPHLPILSTYQVMPLPDMHQRDVHYIVPSVPESNEPTESWSASTYCSLPSKHGIPISPNGSKPALCDICIAEMKKDQIKHNINHVATPTSVEFDKEKFRNSTASSEKTPLSEYVQRLAKKYLVTKSTRNSQQNESNILSLSDSACSNTKTTSPAFEKEVIGKSKIGVFNEFHKSKEFISVPPKNMLPKDENTFQTSPLVVEKFIPVKKTETFVKMGEAKKEMIEKEKFQDDIYLKIKDNELHKSPSELSEYDYEVKRIQAIHQTLSCNFPRFELDDNNKSESKNIGKETMQSSILAQNEIIAKPHIYHELSTIQEVDSALTASSLQLSQPKLSDTSGSGQEKDALSKEKLDDSVQSTDRLKMVSLLDPPDTKIAELAKSIHFVPETEKKINHSLETSETVFTNSSSDKSTPSQKYLSTPTLSSGSYSTLLSTPSLLSSNSTQSIPFVASRENTDSQNGIIPNDLDIQDRIKSRMLQLKEDEQDMNTIISGYISETDVPRVSVGDTPNIESREVYSIISGYISDLEVPHMSTSDAQDKKVKMHSVSGYNSDLDDHQLAKSDILNLVHDENNIHSMSKYHSDLKMPKMIETDISHSSQKNKDNKQFIKYGYIRNDNILHGYDSRKFLPMTPHSNISSPDTYKDINCPLKCEDLKQTGSDEDFKLKQGQLLRRVTSGGFKPMTLHSSVSSPSELVIHYFQKNIQDGSSAGSFKALTPHSNVSSPAIDIFSPNDKHKEYDSTGSFKPMIPHSNVSSPGELATHNFEKQIQNSDSAGSFKALMPHSNVSSPGSDTFFHNEKHKEYDSTGNFKPMIPYSNVSSFSELASQNFKKDIENDNSAGSFKALTPHSNVSSPVSDVILSFENVPLGDASNSRKIQDKISSENYEIKPVILRLNISTDSLTLSAVKNKSSETKQISQINCNLTLNTLLKPTNYNLSTQLPKADINAEEIDNRKYSDRSKNKIKKRHKRLHLTTQKQYALACSSDFFIPSLNEASNTLNENMNKDLSKVTATSDNLNKLEPVFDSQMTVSDGYKKSEVKLKKISVENESISEPINSDKKILKKDAEGKILVEKSEETHQTQVQLGNIRKQYSNLQGLSSASSSSENLSVISRSKVVYQSTPIKNMSELLQEPGILEEPNLTLINTDLSCKIDTTELQKDPLTSIPFKAHKEMDCIVGSSQNECKTPISLSPQFLGSPDTPSMISFLQHEQSCKQTGNDCVVIQTVANKNSARQNLQENDTPVLREVKRSLFQKDGYKERTKRLWNNLEEVKKKNLADERKKEIENNRRKAKEFAKKLTPKQRRK